MPSPYELNHVADLIKLAADTAKACSEVSEDADTSRIQEIALRIKAAAEELQEAARDYERRSQRRDH